MIELYPKHEMEDALLRLCHDNGHDEGEEARWRPACGGEEAGSDDSSTESESDDAEGPRAGADEGAKGAGAAAAANGESARADSGPQSRTARPELSAGLATAFEDCQLQLSTLEAVHSDLRTKGLFKQAHVI